MIENATNLAGIMNLAIQLERTSGAYTYLKAFFLESYIGNILLATLIGVTIMLFFFEYKIGRKQKHIERIQQEYGKLLKPDAVKLEYKRGGLKYSSEKDLDFEDFLNEVKKQKKYRKYKLDELYDAVSKAVEENENSSIYSPHRLSHNHQTNNRNYTIVQKSKKHFLSNSMHIYSQTFLKLLKYHLEECVS